MSNEANPKHALWHWGEALKDYGWVLAIAVVVLAVLWVTYVYNPVKTVEQEVLEPAGAAVGVVSRLCPNDWSDSSTTDEHTLVKSCERRINGELWVVVLHEDGSFNYAIVPNSPSFQTDKSKVPEWPR